MDPNQLAEALGEVVGGSHRHIVRAVAIGFIGLITARFTGRALGAVVVRRFDAQRAMLARRAALYLLVMITAVSVLRELGFDLSVVLGADGTFSVAIGFASQTTASNFVSSLFLIFEEPFKVDDIILVGGTAGVVLSIDPQSVKLRTFDNVFVRVPNETLIKTEVRHLTRFDIRRVDVPIGVAYKEDLPRVREILADVCEQLPEVSETPAPEVLLVGYGTSSIDHEIRAWCVRTRLLQVKTQLIAAAKARFDAEEIEIPFPHLSLYAGSDSTPIRVRSENADEKEGEA